MKISYRKLNGKGILNIAPGVETDAQLNYAAKVAKLLTTVTPEQAAACDVVVYHDDWCACHRGEARCTCNPNVELMPKAAASLLPPLSRHPI